MIPMPIFRDLDGFDAQTFFLYCDDVDFSWRVRLLGKKVLFCPSALVFHDKRLSPDAGWMPSGAERYYSIEAALLMAQKWSRPERVSALLRFCDDQTDEVFLKAAREFRAREREGRLPPSLDPAHEVSEFLGDNYCVHRFVL
jgi:GT2 family glycosyltransferase